MKQGIIHVTLLVALSATAALTTPILLILPFFLLRRNLSRSFADLLDRGLMREMSVRAHPVVQHGDDAHKALAREIVDSTLFWAAVSVSTYFFVDAVFV